MSIKLLAADAEGNILPSKQKISLAEKKEMEGKGYKLMRILSDNPDHNNAMVKKWVKLDDETLRLIDLDKQEKEVEAKNKELERKIALIEKEEKLAEYQKKLKSHAAKK